MKANFLFIALLVILNFRGYGQNTSFNKEQFKPSKQSEIGMDYSAVKKHNIEFNVGGMFRSDGDYFYYTFGLGYEFRPLDYLGIELAFNSGKMTLRDNLVSDADEDNKYIYYGKQYFDSKVNTFSIGPQFYLPLNIEKGFFLFAGLNLGLYTMQSNGRTEDDGTVIGSDKVKFDNRFYSQIKVGTNINLSRQVMVAVAIAGDNIDFEHSADQIDWGTNWAKELSPDLSVYLQSSFIFSF